MEKYMKNKSEISTDELKEKMTQHAIRLGIIEDGISVYCCCLEQETYKESITELWNLGVILQEYIRQTKEEFRELTDGIGMLY